MFRASPKPPLLSQFSNISILLRFLQVLYDQIITMINVSSNNQLRLLCIGMGNCSWSIDVASKTWPQFFLPHYNYIVVTLARSWPFPNLKWWPSSQLDPPPQGHPPPWKTRRGHLMFTNKMQETWKSVPEPPLSTDGRQIGSTWKKSWVFSNSHLWGHLNIFLELQEGNIIGFSFPQ